MSEQTITETEEVEQDHIAGADEMVDEGAISNATPEGECPVDTPDDDVASTDIVDGPNDAPEADSSPDDEPDTFPREYVEKLRDENAKYRQRAGQADDLAERLHHALVKATGRLMDPSDLEFDESHLKDSQELTASIDDLLKEKPYLGKRTPKGDIGQGASGASETVDLAGMLRSRA
ncbi:hypothetical protein [Brevibacterium aurantiacum]|uniref:Uncharacterized protein n=1 Tax=Brevibacterium aurantiacum TaxID=273384 RepID=A0A1D7W7U9_BREAU|nr:hypothetical protein [Brevibacterium aurantiacum]AOP55060.1 hypothetical protein BLSMQ_3360 [Brevibacterium aurantiacum]RCS95512.1 hypothetical protein CIK60_16775 [Brevibacterium aurantiacum]